MTAMYHYRQIAYAFLKMLVAAVFLLLAAQVLSSCEHKELCYDHPHQQNVEVAFDWSEAPDANPASMSVYLYPVDGGAPKSYELTSLQGGYISVAPGVYNVLCVNSDKETHLIKGMDKFETFEVTSAHTRELQGFLSTMAQSAPRATDAENEPWMVEPEMLWSAHVERVVVKERGEKTLITMKPKARVNSCSVEIKNVKNLHGVKTLRATISGLAGGWLAGLDKLSDAKVTIPFNLTGNADQTTLSGNLSLFGHCPIQPVRHKVMIYAELKDGSHWNYEKDVTDQIHDPEHQDETHIKVEIENLPLPKPVPDNGSGLAPNVGKWNEIHINIPM